MFLFRLLSLRFPTLGRIRKGVTKNVVEEALSVSRHELEEANVGFLRFPAAAGAYLYVMGEFVECDVEETKLYQLAYWIAGEFGISANFTIRAILWAWLALICVLRLVLIWASNGLVSALELDIPSNVKEQFILFWCKMEAASILFNCVSLATINFSWTTIFLLVLVTLSQLCNWFAIRSYYVQWKLAPSTYTAHDVLQPMSKYAGRIARRAVQLLILFTLSVYWIRLMISASLIDEKPPLCKYDRQIVQMQLD